MPSENPLPARRRQLRRRLLALPYRAFLQTVIYVLSAEGYGVVRPTGRERLKGHNRAGGWDAESTRAVGALGVLHCLIQAKQFDTLPVHQRAVDELRGSCLRAGAHRAVLVTLSTFSAVARTAAAADTRLAPIRLIDGDELLDLLIARNIGVLRETGKEADKHGEASERWEVNDAYFDFVEGHFGTIGTPSIKAMGTTKIKPRVEQGSAVAPSVTIMLTLNTEANAAFKPERL